MLLSTQIQTDKLSLLVWGDRMRQWGQSTEGLQGVDRVTHWAAADSIPFWSLRDWAYILIV